MTTSKKIKLNTETHQERGKATFFALIAAGFGALGCFLIFINLIVAIQLNSKPAPTLVQTETGEAFPVEAKSKYHRDDRVIQRFTRRIMTAAFTWDGFLIPETPEQARAPIKDNGVEILVGDSGKKYYIATSTHEASFAFDPQFQQQFLESIAEIFPESTLNGNKQTHIIIKEILDPVPIKGQSNAWKVNMVATLITFANNNKLTDPIPFNKEIYIRAIDPPEYTDKDKDNNYYTKVIANYRQAGLEIFDIREYELNTLH